MAGLSVRRPRISGKTKARWPKHGIYTFPVQRLFVERAQGDRLLEIEVLRQREAQQAHHCVAAGTLIAHAAPDRLDPCRSFGTGRVDVAHPVSEDVLDN